MFGLRGRSLRCQPTGFVGFSHGFIKSPLHCADNSLNLLIVRPSIAAPELLWIVSVKMLRQNIVLLSEQHVGGGAEKTQRVAAKCKKTRNFFRKTLFELIMKHFVCQRSGLRSIKVHFEEDQRLCY